MAQPDIAFPGPMPELKPRRMQPDIDQPTNGGGGYDLDGVYVDSASMELVPCGCCGRSFNVVSLVGVLMNLDVFVTVSKSRCLVFGRLVAGSPLSSPHFPGMGVSRVGVGWEGVGLFMVKLSLTLLFVILSGSVIGNVPAMNYWWQ